LRLFQLSRPGYLSGYTQYDDGVYFGNALRLVHGAIAYRDFAMVQPPGSMLLMAPLALAAKVLGTAWGLAAARLLTVLADTANVVLIGLLVRHRGTLAAGLACGGYAVYPAALVASQSLFLEPWLNLFCLLGAVLLFRSGQLPGPRGLAWSGACFGFAAAVKIWALAPALLAGWVCRRERPGRGWFAFGFAAGLAAPCLPFLVLAPSGFGRTVFVSELVQATHGRFGPKLRLADITGLTALASGSFRLEAAIAVSAVIGLLIAVAWILTLRPFRAGRDGGSQEGGRLTALDRYVLLGVVVVTVMMFLPSEWYEHYAAFDGPFLVLAVALPVGRLAAVTRPGSARAFVVAVATTLVIAVMALASVSTSVMQGPVRSYASADSIIPPGACVVTDTASATIAINRFNATSSGCPQLVDSVGTLIATTDGQDLTGSRAVLAADTRVWQDVFSRAEYVWLTGRSGNTGARIAWTPALHAYFVRQFRLVGFASTFHGDGNVPRGGLYARRELLPRNRFPGAANKSQQQHDAAWRLHNDEVAVRVQLIRIVSRPRHVPKRHAVVVLGYPEQEARPARLVEPQRPTCPRMRDLNSHRLAGTAR
jgi:alpha-1,2-mannosyltransferase